MIWRCQIKRELDFTWTVRYCLTLTMPWMYHHRVPSITQNKYINKSLKLFWVPDGSRAILGFTSPTVVKEEKYSHCKFNWAPGVLTWYMLLASLASPHLARPRPRASASCLRQRYFPQKKQVTSDFLLWLVGCGEGSTTHVVQEPTSANPDSEERRSNQASGTKANATVCHSRKLTWSTEMGCTPTACVISISAEPQNYLGPPGADIC